MVKKPKHDDRASTAEAEHDQSVEPSLFIRIKFGDRAFIGPGKVQLLEPMWRSMW